MPGIFANLTTWIDQRQKECWPESITYQRGSSTVALTATIGTTDSERAEAGGVVFSFNSIDFLVLSSQLVIDGITITPQRGDLITWDSRVYVVTSENSGEKPYADSGPGPTVYRIHAKLQRDNA